MEIANSTYRVHLEQFEGPLDLLLHLVREAKLDITEISLANVAQQYFNYLNSMQQLDVELESSYLVVFAQLLELKSRLLLPIENEDECDCADPLNFTIDDEDRPLVEKLANYARLKEITSWFRQREDDTIACYPRPMPMLSSLEPELDISLKLLLRTMRRLERASRAPRSTVTVAKIVLSVPERIVQILAFLDDCPHTNLIEMLGANFTPDMVIVTFLALLELVKERQISVSQESTVGDISIVKIARHEEY